MKGFTATFLVLVCGLSLCLKAMPEIEQIKSRQHIDQNEQELLYLPDKAGLKFLSFGYNNLLADLLWFRTISYFGKHFSSDQNYRWLAHMCDLVSDLSPHEMHVYRFCSTMLSWESAQAQEAIKILSKAISYNPEEWMYLYLRGVTYYHFLKDPEKAGADFLRASHLPGAHPLVKRMAARQLAVNDPAESIRFLSEMIEMTSDPQQKEVLIDKLREMAYERDASQLEQALDIYKNQQGHPASSLQELVEAGIISELPPDPFGGTYTLDPKSGRVISSTAKPRKLK